jgi:hypothetical protein
MKTIRPLLALKTRRKQKVSSEGVEIPRWVPVELHDEFLDVASLDGEEAAASHIRRRKRATSVPMTIHLRCMKAAQSVCDLSADRMRLINSSSQEDEIIRARHLVAYLLRVEHGYTTIRVGKIINRDRSVVGYSVKAAKKKFTEDELRRAAQLVVDLALEEKDKDFPK